MRLTKRVLVEEEQLPESIEREVTFRIFLLVHHSRRQSLLISLPLKDLLLDRTGGDEPVDETFFLLSVTPHSRKCLLIGGRIPVFSCVSLA